MWRWWETTVGDQKVDENSDVVFDLTQKVLREMMPGRESITAQ